jgi:hypothetical protein
MTVDELVSELQEYDGDLPVHFAHNSGDYWRTVIAPSVDQVEEGLVVPSAYHQTPKVVGEDDDHSGKTKPTKVLLLR